MRFQCDTVSVIQVDVETVRAKLQRKQQLHSQVNKGQMRLFTHQVIEEAQNEDSFENDSLTPFTETKWLSYILVADDRLLNLELIKENFKQLDLTDRSEFFIDGVSLLERAKKIMTEAFVKKKGMKPI